MEKKLTDLIEMLEDDLLEDIEEQEVDEDMAQRIKSRALEPTSKKIVPFKRPRIKRILLVAVITGLLTTTIGAISSNKTLRQFFNQHLSILLPSTQEVAKSISYNGITMTIDTAFGGNSGGVIVINFTKDDGSSFEVGEQFKDFQVKIEEANSGLSYGHGWELSEDKKVLTYIVDLKTDGDLVGKGITITAKDSVIIYPKEEVMSLNLADLYENKQIDSIKNLEDEQMEKQEEKLIQEENDIHEEKQIERKEKPEGIFLEHPYSDVVLSDIDFSKDELKLGMEYTYLDKALWYMFELYDTRTNETIEATESRSMHSSRCPVITETWTYEGITKDDLPYLRLKKYYNEYKYITKGTWKNTFTLQKNSNVKKLKKSIHIPLKEGYFKIEDIELSVIGIHVKGTVNHPSEKDNILADNQIYEELMELEKYILMKDGERVKLSNTLCSGSNDQFITYLTLVNDLDWENMSEEEKAIKRKQAMEESRKAQSNLLNMIQDRYIDVNQVEALEIQGVKIPLK